MHFKNSSLFITAAFILAITACKEDDLLPPANTNAYISFINTSPYLGNDGRGDATAVRTYVDTKDHPDTAALLITYNAIYPAPNKYLPFKEGDCKVSFQDSSRSPLASGSITTRTGAYYTAILADSMDTYAAILVQDDYEAVPGKALVRVMHFSPDGGELVLYRDTMRLENFGTLQYRQVTPYTPVEPGTNFSFILRKNDGTHQRVARFFTSSLLGGTAYTLLLKGYVQPPDGDLANKGSQLLLFRN